MLSTVSTPKTKSDLLRSIQQLRNPRIKVHEITDPKGVETLRKELQTNLRKSSLSVIVLQEI